MANSALMAISDRNSAAPVKWADNALHVGGIHHVGFGDVHHCWWPDPPYRPWGQPIVTTTHITTQVKPNPTETAFKIVSRMIADGIVEDLTVKKFVKLVDDVAKIVKES